MWPSVLPVYALTTLVNLHTVTSAPSAPRALNGAYFILNPSAPLVTERLDPLLSPGAPSNHLHTIIGGNGFKATMAFSDTQAASCSTVSVKADKSNYWTPSLFFHAKNGTFIRVPYSYNQIYYKYGKSDQTYDTQQSEFPQGFQMIAGNAQLRSSDSSLSSTGTALQWKCSGSAGTKSAVGFPTGFTDCNTAGVGLYSTMRFPSCWNGNAFSASSPGAHMTFPTAGTSGLAGCPAPFNVKRFPEILLETFYNINAFNGLYAATDTPWILANGDPTGYSFHADFVNGWVPGQLQHAMQNCNVGGSGGPLDSSGCFGSGGLYTSSQQSACTLPSHVNEAIGAVGTPLSALPGCNPVQPGPATATIQTGCGAPTTLS